jgi:hypothetical protein
MSRRNKGNKGNFWLRMRFSTTFSEGDISAISLISAGQKKQSAGH